MDYREPKEGYFRVRAYRNGPWIPIRIWLEDGERDPETGELLSDQYWRAEQNKSPTDPYAFEQIDPLQENSIYWREITKEQFTWLVIQKTL